MPRWPAPMPRREDCLEGLAAETKGAEFLRGEAARGRAAPSRVRRISDRAQPAQRSSDTDDPEHDDHCGTDAARRATLSSRGFGAKIVPQVSRNQLKNNQEAGGGG